MRPAVPPEYMDRLASPNDAALPRIPISSPGAASHRTMPPKALNGIANSPRVADRWGWVAAVTNDTGGAARAAVDGSNAASFWPVLRAVGVTPTVESRAKVINIGAAEPAAPPMKISNTVSF